MTPKKIQTSGISKTTNISKVPKLPQVLSYPVLLNNESLKHIQNINSYIIRNYQLDGLAVLIYRQPSNDQTVVIFGDWKGNSLDLQEKNNLTEIANKFLEKDLSFFVKFMHHIKLTQAQYFFSLNKNNELMLVDLQVGINKFSGPGMIRDLFSNTYYTQEILKIELIDDRAIEYITKGNGSYEGDLIIKPCKFRTYDLSDKYQPLYVQITR